MAASEQAAVREPKPAPVSGPALEHPELPAFETLISTHGAAVLRVCRALVGLNDADDIWQETFLAALRAYPGSAGIRNREAWLVMIARNKAIDHLRRTVRVPEPVEDTGDGALEGGDVVVHAVEAGETAAEVWAALARLPQRQREAVIYHHVAGLRYAEVAALLGNSEAAARRAASDGMATLRTLLGDSSQRQHLKGQRRNRQEEV